MIPAREQLGKCGYLAQRFLQIVRSDGGEALQRFVGATRSL